MAQRAILDAATAASLALARVAAFAPAVWVAVFVVQSAAATMLLGRLPRYGQPDPKTMEPIWALVLLGQWLLVFAVVSPLFVAGHTALCVLRDRALGLGRGAMAAFLIAVTLALAIVLTNPLGLVSWYFD